ncbi:hypothetical protein JVU11DRAFT_6587 [Chiua virens]|nr:hypothetical protein JVU11DRAFT_6587 [Chiua virens]
MHNGPVVTNDDLTVAEVKEKAKEDVLKAAKGVSAISLIKTARTQSQLARDCEIRGNLKAALGALLKAGSLTHMFMNSTEFMAETKPPGRHGVLYKEFIDFQKTEGSNFTERVQAIEAKLTDLEKSAATDDNTDAGQSRRVGTSIADRVRKLNDAGLALDPSKRTSREFPVAPSTPPFIPLKSPAPIRMHKLSPTLVSVLPPPVSAIIPPSNNSSTASSPHAVVPPSSLGPPSPTSSGSSSPPLAHTTIAGFSQAFPSIDELDEFSSRFPPIPVSEPTGGKGISHSSPISQSNSVNGVEPSASPIVKQFPSLSIDPGPRPSSTPITPTINAFMSRPASPAVTRPPINNFVSSPLVSKTSPGPSKPILPELNTISPELLRDYLDSPGLKTLVVDVRTREEFDNEHVNADAIVCLEPSVLTRPSVTAASLEDTLCVAPREERVLFENRDKFDLVVFYDTSSETYDGGPLSGFVRAVFLEAFRKFLRHAPVLLVGGLHAWKEKFPDKVARGTPGGSRVPPHNTLENGISSTSSANSTCPPVFDTSRNWSPPGPPHVNGALTEQRLPEAFPSPPGKSSAIESIPDPAILIRRQATSKPSSSISHSHSQSESISLSPRPSAQSFGSGTTSTSITYPSIIPTSPPVTSASSFSPSPSSFTPVSLPPQASINPSPLARRRSEYMNGSTVAGFSHRPTSIDYPDLHVIRPPPPVATPVSERQDSRPRLLRSSSQSVSVSYQSSPKPPTIQSNYPVIYWSDIQNNTTGLKNLGNTCYMNATIQCLNATVPFARFFTDGRWKNAVNMLNPMGTKGVLVNAFASILYEMSHSELPHFTPLPFRKSICHHAPQFGGSDQHDSQEFLTFLLDGLHEDLNRVFKKPSSESSPEREAELEKLPQQIASEQEWEIYRMRNDSLIVDYFQGQFRNKMECLTCHHTSTTYNSFMYLSLPMPSVKGPSKVSLYSCLDAFVKEEVLEKSEAWHCPKCKTLRSATKMLSLSRLPAVLLIHLKRFSVKGLFTDKIETIVDFPLKALDLTNYMPPPLPPAMRKIPTSAVDDPRVQVPPYRYDLYAITNHFGSLSNGHYTAFVASQSGWRYCDDSRITNVDSKEVVGRPAYVLYYKRVKP